MLIYKDEKLICRIGIYESSPCMAIRFILESGEPFYTLTVNPPKLLWREFAVPNLAVLNLDLDHDQQPMIDYLCGRYDSTCTMIDTITGNLQNCHLFYFDPKRLIEVDSEGYNQYICMHNAYFNCN